MQTPTVSREIQLAARPRGVPGPDSFSWAERPVPDPGPGEVVVVEGLEAMPDAFLGLYRGDNIGKMVVRLGDAR